MQTLRKLHKNTMQALGAPHTLPTLVAPFLFLMLSGMAVFLLCRFLAVFMVLYLPTSTANLLQLTVIPVLSTVLVVCLVLPVWLGRLRMAGLLLLDEQPTYGALFYYFGKRCRYAKALLVSAVLALAYGLLGLALYGTAVGAWHLYQAVILVYLPQYAAISLLVLLPLVLAVMAGALYLSGIFLPFAALFVGNEELPFGALLARSVRVGRKNLTKIFVFSLKQLGWLALCLVSVMVLYVLWYSHYFNLIYLRYSMALFEEDVQ